MPRFKTGDIIQLRNGRKVAVTEVVYDHSPWEDEYELSVPNKGVTMWCQAGEIDDAGTKWLANIYQPDVKIEEDKR
jgi:hypothetical protein